MTPQKFLQALVSALALAGLATTLRADPIAMKYPWLAKRQTELTHNECLGAMRHDSNFWWARGRCHMKFIRYAMGVAIQDSPAKEDAAAVLKKGDLLTTITAYLPKDDVYCQHGGYCYPAKQVKLLGSVILNRADDSDNLEVASSCELILADRAAIREFHADRMFRDCR